MSVIGGEGVGSEGEERFLSSTKLLTHYIANVSHVGEEVVSCQGVKALTDVQRWQAWL